MALSCIGGSNPQKLGNTRQLFMSAFYCSKQFVCTNYIMLPMLNTVFFYFTKRFYIAWFVESWLLQKFPLHFYRQHCAQRKPAGIGLLRGRFWGFSPRRGDTLHRWGWNLAWSRGPLLHAKFHPHRCNVKGVGPPKLKFLLRFDRNLEYKRPAGTYPLRDFHKICRVCTSFQAALGVKIWLDLRDYGG